MQHYVGIVCLALVVGGTLWLRHVNPPEEPVAPEPPAPPANVAQEEPEASMARIQMREISDAVELYKLTHKKVPDSLDQLTEPDEDGNRFMNEVPDDPWDTSYDYRPDGRRGFHLSSAGPDGQYDTADDIVHGQ